MRHGLRFGNVWFGNHVDILVNCEHRNEHVFGVKTAWRVNQITNRTETRDSLI